MRIALVNAPLVSAVSDLALAHQIPLGLLMVAGPLIDDGFVVNLLDAAREHCSDAQIIRWLNEFRPDLILVGHSASTPSHPCSLRLLREVKLGVPQAVTVYGGVYPTFQFEDILAGHPEVDVIVCGEGEATVLDLVRTLARATAGPQKPILGSTGIDLSSVAGIAWRRGKHVVVNAPRPPCKNLDGWRIAWELIRDWDMYQAFGQGRTAVVQFSRGCPHHCTYCGQWSFWQQWRHRDVASFVDELEFLHGEHNVQFFWFADENPTTQKQVWRSFLKEVVDRNLRVGMTASIRARDIVRDADILDLYRQAGFLYVLMGVETASNEVLRKLRKDSSVDDACQAVRLLRAHGILSIIDYIFGIERETWRTMWRAFSGLCRYGSDFVNALYLTPHPWTPAMRSMKNCEVIEDDLWKWDYRHQVVSIDGLSPTQLFLGMKMIELLYHLHPKRLGRMVCGGDPRVRHQIRFAYGRMIKVFFREIYQFVCGRGPRKHAANETSIVPGLTCEASAPLTENRAAAIALDDPQRNRTERPAPDEFDTEDSEAQGRCSRRATRVNVRTLPKLESGSMVQSRKGKPARG